MSDIKKKGRDVSETSKRKTERRMSEGEEDDEKSDRGGKGKEARTAMHHWTLRIDVSIEQQETIDIAVTHHVPEHAQSQRLRRLRDGPLPPDPLSHLRHPVLESAAESPEYVLERRGRSSKNSVFIVYSLSVVKHE